MNEVQVIEELKKIFKLVINRNADVEKIVPSSKIVEDLGVNSVGLIYLAIAIEETFDIDMTSVSVSTFCTVQDVVTYIIENCK